MDLMTTMYSGSDDACDNVSKSRHNLDTEQELRLIWW